MRRSLALGALALALLLGARAAVAAPAVGEGSAIVAIGGALADPAIYAEIVRLGGGPGKARVGLLTTSSGDPAGSAVAYERAFADLGVEVVWLPVTTSAPGSGDDPAIAAAAASCDVFFLGGGTQTRYTDALLRPDGTDGAVLAAIRRRFARGGAVIAGTSAGAAALTGAAMITGGESDVVLRKPRTLRDRRGGGLGFFPWGTLDTHFGERGRQGRLIRLAARRRAGLAFGVGEDTALVVTGVGGAGEPGFAVVGQGAVEVFDLARARRGRGGQVRGVRGHRLTAGDRYELGRRRVRFARDKRPGGDAVDAAPADVGDVFGALDAQGNRPNRGAFGRVAIAAAGGAPVVGTPKDAPGWVVRLGRGRGGGRATSTDGRRTSVRNLRIDLVRSGGRRSPRAR